MIERVSTTGSTNADLASRLRAGERIGEGYWLVADRQSAGKGRQGREWFDGLGNFMGSTIIRLSPADPAPATLALVAGLAVYEAVLPHCPDPSALRLKWPNDLMLCGAKLAGNLLERVDDCVVVGIGVNLVAAPDLADRVTVSLQDLGPAPEGGLFAGELARSFAQEVQRWRTFGIETLLRRWQSAGTPKGTPVTVHEQADGFVSGIFGGLMPDGSMRLCLADGSHRAIHAGDVILG